MIIFWLKRSLGKEISQDFDPTKKEIQSRSQVFAMIRCFQQTPVFLHDTRAQQTAATGAVAGCEKLLTLFIGERKNPVPSNQSVVSTL